MQKNKITYLLVMLLVASFLGAQVAFSLPSSISVNSIDTHIINSLDTIPLKNSIEGSIETNKIDTIKADSLDLSEPKFIDSLETSAPDTLPKGKSLTYSATSVLSDSTFLRRDTTAKSNFVDEIIETTNKDSMILNLFNDKLYLYTDAEVVYVDNTLKADIIEIDINNNNVFAKGTIDTVEIIEEGANPYKRISFLDKEVDYQLDSIKYNLKSEKGKIYGVYFEDQEGYIHGETVKKVDETMNILKGKYTSCDLEHPHFYLASSKAQYKSGKDSKEIIIGPSYLVIEDVPIPLIIPFGFFPVMSERSSGLKLPTVGEENLKGFFLRDGGWYQVINDYWDAQLTGGIYTLGSWNVSLESNYAVRYKFKGNFSFDYSRDKIGEEGDSGFADMKNYKLKWTHSQDAKARPGSTFSASVNFATSGYNKYDGNLEDYVSAQTSSSVSYSKTWLGTPLSFSTQFQQSQNNKDSSVVLSIPNYSFNVSKIYPFRRKVAMGEQKWYEKISLSYSNTFSNTINTTEKDLFTSRMFDNLKLGMKHAIPVSTSFNLLKYINISPSVNYNERWYVEKVDKSWNPDTESLQVDTLNGFYRVYDYSGSLSFSTTLYGMYTFKKGSKVQAIRHVFTPSFSFSYSPNFGASSYGYYKTVQVNNEGDVQQYSPYEGSIYGVPSNGEQANLGISFGNNVEMKVASDKDSTGFKKVKILESLSLSTSYNFLADSLNLAPISISGQTTLFKSMGINFRAVWDLYKYNENGVRTNDFAWTHGSFGRFTNLSFSFGYSFRSVFGYEDGTGSQSMTQTPTAPLQGSGVMGAPTVSEQAGQNAIDRAKYYNFSIPWNFSFQYNFSMNNTGISNSTAQTLAINADINLTPKWAISTSAGVDLSAMKLTPGAISIIRDLHCWQMSFTWVPVGFRTSWNFNINVKSSALQDLKFKRSSSFLDNFYNTY